MKVSAIIVVLAAVMVLPSAAQSRTENPFREQIWEVGPWVGGGTGLGASGDFKFVHAGVRVGHVLTDEIGSGRFRGTFEWAADVTPVFVVRQPEFRTFGPSQWVYGGGVSPVVLKWNFTAVKRQVPYVSAEAGVVVTTRDVPPGNTSTVNFSPGLAVGTYVLHGRRSAIDFSLHFRHISNASLGSQNPGINMTALVRVGYTWFR